MFGKFDRCDLHKSLADTEHKGEAQQTVREAIFFVQGNIAVQTPVLSASH